MSVIHIKKPHHQMGLIKPFIILLGYDEEICHSNQEKDDDDTGTHPKNIAEIHFQICQFIFIQHAISLP
jgi:hypothetical protein